MPGPTGTTGPQGFTGPTGPYGVAGPTGSYCTGNLNTIATRNWWGTNYSGGSFNFNGPLDSVFDGVHIWITNNGNDTVTGINACDGSFFMNLSGAPYNFATPVGIAFDGVRIWVVNQGNNTVTSFNAVDGSFNSILSGAPYNFNNPWYICFDGTKLWVTNEGTNSVTSFFTSGVFSSVLSGAPYNFLVPRQIFFDGTQIWVGNLNGAVVFDASTSTFAFNLPFASRVNDFAFDGIYMWLCIDIWFVNIYDTSGLFITSIDTSMPPYGIGNTIISIGFDGFSRMWLGVNEASGIIIVINVPTISFNKVMDPSSIPWINTLDVSSWTFDGKYIWGTNSTNDTITNFFIGK